LPEVVAGFDHIAAVAIDECGKMRRHDVALVKNVGTFFKIADPKIMGMIPTPSFAHFGSGYAELDTGSASMFKVSIQGGAGDPGPVHVLEEEVDGLRAATGLFFLQLDGLLYCAVFLDLSAFFAPGCQNPLSGSASASDAGWRSRACRYVRPGIGTALRPFV